MSTMTFTDVTDKGEAEKMFARCLDGGVNFLDTADVYTATRSQEILDGLMGDHRRELVIAAKV